MTIEECRAYLPDGWTEIIQKDSLLMEIFREHEYELENEAVPPFLFQELRGGNMECLRPIFALYGQAGLEMLQGILEIEESSKETAEVRLPDGQTAYAGYFFVRFSEEDRKAAENAVRTYIQDINRIFTEEFEEDAPLDADAEIEFLSGQAGRDFRAEAHRRWCEGEGTDADVENDLRDWCFDLPYRKGCEDIELLSEALYHISCDYLLSYYLQWPMFDTEQKNPFHAYFQLWKMGLTVYFPERSRAVLVG